LNGASSFDTANCKTTRINETAYNPRLPLQWTLHCLVEFVGLRKIDYVDIPIRSANYEHVVDGVHRVHPLLTFQGSSRVGRPQIPKFDRLVPGASDEHVGAIVVRLEHLYTFDRLVVRGNLA